MSDGPTSWVLKGLDVLGRIGVERSFAFRSTEVVALSLEHASKGVSTLLNDLLFADRINSCHFPFFTSLHYRVNLVTSVIFTAGTCR